MATTQRSTPEETREKKLANGTSAPRAPGWDNGLKGASVAGSPLELVRAGRGAGRLTGGGCVDARDRQAGK
eukprot:50787-Pleurochrysis_carterae.AAC.1